MKYKSKIGWWFHLVVLFSLLGCALPLYLGIIYEDAISLIIGISMFVIVEGILILPIYFNTRYTLEETSLYVRCGFCINKRIDYKDIKHVYETRDPSASAGLSLDRISINYTNGEILISPKNKHEFMEQLKQRT